jgi:hypothetical protein
MRWVAQFAQWTLRNAPQISSLTAAVGALGAVWIYYRKSALDRATWLSSLYTKFYEADKLKQTRNTLDESLPDAENVQKMVDDEDPNFTDYLNFFEFMAYLEERGQLSEKDVAALFDYYLRNLSKHKSVRKYIGKDKKGYGYLQKLLRRFPAEE